MSMRFWFSRVAGFFQIALLLMGVASPVFAASPATAAGWKLQRTPNPRMFSTAGLVGVSCKANACTAVGSYSHRSGKGLTLAERWIKGRGWKVQSTPNPRRSARAALFGVSCTAANACQAVGSSERGTLGERWTKGKGWKILSTPNPTGSTSAVLEGVACTGANACTAVGSYTDGSGNEVTLAERWNGRRWAIQSTPNPTGSTSASLKGVSCRAKACIAVGSSDTSGTLAERWNGTEWTIQSTPNPTPGRPALDGVSCSAANACTAVGADDSGTLAERWNGTEWRIQSTPKKGTGPRLHGVSCPATNACTAVGEYSSKTLASRMLAVYWNGKKWTTQSTPKPTGSHGAGLVGASCRAANVCTAVGFFEKTRASGGRTLAQRRS